jgi:hypothetical protein
MFRPYKAIYRTAATRVSPCLLHATTARRCLGMYAHASLTLPSYCGVHAVFLLCVALPSRACIPCIVAYKRYARNFYNLSLMLLKELRQMINCNREYLSFAYSAELRKAFVQWQRIF